MILNPAGMDANGQFRIATSSDSFPLVASSNKGAGGTPTLTLATAAGSGATRSIEGNNVAGKITLTTGLTLLSSGLVMTLGFADGLVYPNGCHPQFTAGNENFAGVYIKLYAVGKTTGVELYVTAALSLSQTYVGTYHITGF